MSAKINSLAPQRAPAAAPPSKRQRLHQTAITDLFRDDDIEDDPFASDSDSGKKKQRKEAKNGGDDIGVDKAVEKQKVREPRIKLDAERLLSKKGIQALRERAKELKLKGKGHEFSDASRLLSYYQLWLDDLFPKARFLDALAMVEKVGHTRVMQIQRLQWINEGKPKSTMDGDDLPEDQETGGNTLGPSDNPAPLAPIFNSGEDDRPRTPEVDDLFGDEDIYNATPGARTAGQSIFGGGKPSGSRPEDDDDEDLDALIAEAGMSERNVEPRAKTASLFGPARSTPPVVQSTADPDEDDLDALMAEDQAQGATKVQPAPVGHVASTEDNEEDDLDALMAEAEAAAGSKAKPDLPEALTRVGTGTEQGNFADDEEAMAEMGGLW